MSVRATEHIPAIIGINLISKENGNRILTNNNNDCSLFRYVALHSKDIVCYLHNNCFPMQIQTGLDIGTQMREILKKSRIQKYCWPS